MIRLDVQQGSPEWAHARLGIPTASEFSRILTPKTLRPSESAVGYHNELLAEWLLGEPLESGDDGFMRRGHVLEEDAVRYYEFERGLDVDRVGFVLRDDRRSGCSPDGLVGVDGLLEIKCPSPAMHVGYLLEAPVDKYRLQVQGNVWIAERDWCDLLSYHPSLPPALVRCYRDDKVIKALAAVVEAFCDHLAEARARLEARGLGPFCQAGVTDGGAANV